MDITLRELLWRMRMIARRWRFRLWAPKPTKGEPQVQNLDGLLRAVVYDAPAVTLWHGWARVPGMQEDVPRGAESEETS